MLTLKDWKIVLLEAKSRLPTGCGVYLRSTTFAMAGRETENSGARNLVALKQGLQTREIFAPLPLFK